MITLKNPENGATVNLLTEVQNGFLESDRVGDDCSFPKEVKFEWEAEGEGTLQVSESEDFEEYYSESGNNSYNMENHNLMSY